MKALAVDKINVTQKLDISLWKGRKHFRNTNEYQNAFTSIYSFFHNVFYPSKKLNFNFSAIRYNLLLYSETTKAK